MTELRESRRNHILPDSERYGSFWRMPFAIVDVRRGAAFLDKGGTGEERNS